MTKNDTIQSRTEANGQAPASDDWDEDEKRGVTENAWSDAARQAALAAREASHSALTKSRQTPLGPGLSDERSKYMKMGIRYGKLDTNYQGHNTAGGHEIFAKYHDKEAETHEKLATSGHSPIPEKHLVAAEAHRQAATAHRNAASLKRSDKKPAADRTNNADPNSPQGRPETDTAPAKDHWGDDVEDNAGCDPEGDVTPLSSGKVLQTNDGGGGGGGSGGAGGGGGMGGGVGFGPGVGKEEEGHEYSDDDEVTNDELPSLKGDKVKMPKATVLNDTGIGTSGGAPVGGIGTSGSVGTTMNDDEEMSAGPDGEEEEGAGSDDAGEYGATVNSWTDEARRASALARQASSKAHDHSADTPSWGPAESFGEYEDETGHSDFDSAMEHAKAADSQHTHQDAATNHQLAAKLHDKTAAFWQKAHNTPSTDSHEDIDENIATHTEGSKLHRAAAAAHLKAAAMYAKGATVNAAEGPVGAAREPSPWDGQSSVDKAYTGGAELSPEYHERQATFHEESSKRHRDKGRDSLADHHDKKAAYHNDQAMQLRTAPARVYNENDPCVVNEERAARIGFMNRETTTGRPNPNPLEVDVESDPKAFEETEAITTDSEEPSKQVRFAKVERIKEKPAMPDQAPRSLTQLPAAEKGQQQTTENELCEPELVTNSLDLDMIELIYNRDWPQAKRDKLPSEDFAGPHQSFPIQKQSDVQAAMHLTGKADDPEAVKSRIRSIAKRKGLTVPDSLKSTTNSQETPMSMTRKEVIDQIILNGCGCWTEAERPVLNSMANPRLLEILGTQREAVTNAKIVAMVENDDGGDQIPSTLKKKVKSFKDARKGDLGPAGSTGDENDDDDREGSDALGVDDAGGAIPARGFKNKGKDGHQINNMEAWMKGAPPEAKEFLKQSMRVVHNEKKRLINEITGNSRSPWDPKMLYKFDLDDVTVNGRLQIGLRSLAVAVGAPSDVQNTTTPITILSPTYNGAEGGGFGYEAIEQELTGNAGISTNENDVLGLPTINWGEDRKEMLDRLNGAVASQRR